MIKCKNQHVDIPCTPDMDCYINSPEYFNCFCVWQHFNVGVELTLDETGDLLGGLSHTTITKIESEALAKYAKGINVRITKLCHKCDKTKDLDLFVGGKNICKECFNRSTIERRWKKKELILQNQEQQKNVESINPKIDLNEIKCVECDKIKPFSEFPKPEEISLNHSFECKSCIKKKRENHLHKREEYIIKEELKPLKKDLTVKSNDYTYTQEDFNAYDPFIYKYIHRWISMNCPSFYYGINWKTQALGITGLTYEDLVQELRTSAWIGILNYDRTHYSEASLKTFVIDCIKNRGQTIARDMWADKRGNGEQHVDGDGISNLFSSYRDFEDD